mmetsp:Transcript_90971/g.262231  ORF Transcript_90971/g.262231 Transcript_90971/m.262231 type:complete len:136 (+) Transcript_90971:643-1050(+)
MEEYRKAAVMMYIENTTKEPRSEQQEGPSTSTGSPAPWLLASEAAAADCESDGGEGGARRSSMGTKRAATRPLNPIANESQKAAGRPPKWYAKGDSAKFVTEPIRSAELKAPTREPQDSPKRGASIGNGITSMLS